MEFDAQICQPPFANPTVESLNSIAKLFGLQVGFVPIRRKVPAS
ncbi:protein of unknown function [Paraburkholderia kururiensis]